MPSSSQTSETARERPALVLAILCGAPFLAALDLFVVNVAFTRIGQDFAGHSLADLSWILNGYAIVYAALLIPLGRWADKVGNKRVFVLGLVLFTAASAAAAISPDLEVLVACRLVQAIGAAALTPTSLGLLIHAVAPQKRAFSVRIWATSSAIASALGPVIGGLLVEASWRWIFLINVPLGIVLVLAASRVVPDHRADDANTELDLGGAVLLALGIGALSMGLVEGNDWGWGSAGVVGSLVVAAVALAGFAVNNARHRSPLIPPTLLRVRTFVGANVTIWLFSASFAAGLLGLILWLQQVWGYSAVTTGLAIAPGPLMVPIFAIGGQALARHVPPGTSAMAGSLLWALGFVMILLSVGPEPSYATAVLPGWLVCGVGVGLALPTILASATAQLPAASSATGSAVVNMTRQVGTVMGVSVLVALLGTTSGYEATHQAFQRGWWVIAALAVAAAVVSPSLTPRKTADVTGAARRG